MRILESGTVLQSLLLTALLALTLAVANAATPAVTSAGTYKPPVPLLWKVSDADNSVYLLGSFHLLRPSDYPLAKEVDAAFADAESLLFELAPEELSSPMLATQMGLAALRTDDTQLDSDLPPAMAKKLEAWIASNAATMDNPSLSSQMLQMFEPWFVGIMISIVEMTKQGLDPKLGLDLHFADAAKKTAKTTAGFETGAQQIAFLDGMSKEEQLQFLADALEQSQEGRDQVEQLHHAWRNGDVATLWNGMAADMRRDYPKLYRHINVERNDAWLPKIEQRLSTPGSDETLVVVGALHLLGSDGIVAKLRARGYRVMRLCSACKASVPASSR